MNLRILLLLLAAPHLAPCEDKISADTKTPRRIDDLQRATDENTITITSKCGKGFAKAFTVTGRVVMKRKTWLNGPPQFYRAFSVKKVDDTVLKEELVMDFIYWYIGIKDAFDNLPLDKDSTLAVYETFEALGNPDHKGFLDEIPSAPAWSVSHKLVVLKILPLVK